VRKWTRTRLDAAWAGEEGFPILGDGGFSVVLVGGVCPYC